MVIALTDLGLSSLAVLYPGQRRATLDRGIELVPLLAVDDFLREQQLLPALPQPPSPGRRRKR